MKKLLVILALLLITPVLGGCETLSKFGGAIRAATTETANPIDREELYKLEVGRNTILRGMNAYADFCYSKPLAELPQSVCANRASIVKRMIAADDKLERALVAAKNFVKNNPTISAASLIGAAKQAFLDFKKVADPVIASVR